MAVQQETAFVYAIGSTNGPTKIGYSLMPKKRLEVFRKKAKRDLEIFGTWPVGAAIALHVERYAHWLLRDKHITGEWFSCNRDEALDAIRRAATEDHDPNYAIPRIDTVGREIKGGVTIPTKYPRGTRERLLNVSPGAYADFIRAAVAEKLEREEAELERRERKPRSDGGK